jgi:flagellar basal body-associated protein FliL
MDIQTKSRHPSSGGAAPQSDKKKPILIGIAIALVAAAIGITLWSMREPPPPPTEAQQADAAMQQAYQEVEAKAAEREKRQLEMRGPGSNVQSQPATEPGGGMKAAPK